MLNYLLINNNTKEVYYNKNIRFTGTLDEYLAFCKALDKRPSIRRILFENASSELLNYYHLSTLNHMGNRPSADCVLREYQETEGDIIL